MNYKFIIAFFKLILSSDKAEIVMPPYDVLNMCSFCLIVNLALDNIIVEHYIIYIY